jgi:hypothetical protein
MTSRLTSRTASDQAAQLDAVLARLRRTLTETGTARRLR